MNQDIFSIVMNYLDGKLPEDKINLLISELEVLHKDSLREELEGLMHPNLWSYESESRAKHAIEDKIAQLNRKEP